MISRLVLIFLLTVISRGAYSQIYLNKDTICDETCRRIGMIQLDWTENIDTNSSSIVLYYTINIDKIIDNQKQKELNKFLDKNLVESRGDTTVYYFYFYRYDLETLSSLISQHSLKTSLRTRRMMFIKLGGWGLGAVVSFINPVAGILVISAGELWSLNQLRKLTNDTLQMSVDVQGK
jgi:hypothetical protein